MKEDNKINELVKTAVNDIFQLARNNAKDNDFILFLSQCSYRKLSITAKNKSYLLSDQIDFLYNRDKIDLRHTYLQNFELVNTEEENNIKKVLIDIELMIYTHLWESDFHIKFLKQLTNLIRKKEFDWINKVGYNRQKYCRDEIIDRLKKESNNIKEVFDIIYNSQFRDAFAHSQYRILNEEIEFLNYEGKSYQKETILISDWKLIFLTTNVFFDMILERFEYNQEQTLGNEFQICYPDGIKQTIKYCELTGRFRPIN
ncbi:MAG: hypothetical protein IPM95_11560 [Sphingobacteriales bacterium]|nr:hypothetical protein [Sphingobacteriales bacterium]